MNEEIRKRLQAICNHFSTWSPGECDYKTPSPEFLEQVKKENPDFSDKENEEEAMYELEFCGDCGASAKDCPIRELYELAFSGEEKGGQP